MVKVHNPSESDIIDANFESKSVHLPAGQSLECSEAQAAWMKKTWEFLTVTDADGDEAEVDTNVTDDEGKPNKLAKKSRAPRKAKEEKKKEKPEE